MRITINHREEASLLGNSRRYYLDLTVLFSEEERAIVDTRKLYENTFNLAPGFLGSSVFFVPVPVIRLCLIAWPFLLLSGCVVGMASIVANTGGLGTLLILLSIGSLGFGLYAKYFLRHGYRTEITVGEIIRTPSFSVLTFNPVQAKSLDAELRDRFTGLKNFLDQSVELAPSDTFEL
jgi:hypothetical protein